MFKTTKKFSLFIIGMLLSVFLASPVFSSETGDWWVSRDKRWQPRGPWNWSLPRELPQLNREFNGIDFGHAHIAETLLSTQDQQRVEKARLEVLDFIFSSPSVPPDEEQAAPTFIRMAWEVQRAFNWTHTFHRALYDLFASDVQDKERAYRKILADYLENPEAITSHRLDHHGKLWSFPESKSFRDKFRKFNTQIWAYHWLQGATYDVQLMGDAERQRELMPQIIEHYQGYLKNPPIEWEFMPLLTETAPEFSARFPEAATIFDNLHMLHDNVDDILSRPDMYATLQEKREAILKVLAIYLHSSHEPEERYAEYDDMTMTEGQAGHGMMKESHEGHGGGMMQIMGQRPPSAKEVLFGEPSDDGDEQPKAEEKPKSNHEQHRGGDK